MITELQKLALLLKHDGAEIIGVTPGTRADVTPEERARAIRKSLIQLRRDPDFLRPVDLST